MKKSIIMFLSLCLILLGAGCGNSEETLEKKDYYVYYINRDETKIAKSTVTLESGDLVTDTEVEAATGEETASTTLTEEEIIHLKDQIFELLTLLTTAPEEANFKAPITDKMGKIKYDYSEGQLTLYFTEEYRELSATTEVLTRAAIVKTLTQLEGVQYVTFMVQEEPLTDKSENLVGLMTADTFIDNEGSEINTYEKATLKLFFASSDGTQLVEANRTVVYNSNISLEKLVVEQLIQGPANSEIYPCINPDTEIINITVKDGVCYVNLDSSFLTPVNDVSAKVTLYSIVNSLVELSNINKVQILIDGETDMTFREVVSLTTILERDLTIVQ